MEAQVIERWKILQAIPNYEQVTGEQLFRKYVRTILVSIQDHVALLCCLIAVLHSIMFTKQPESWKMILKSTAYFDSPKTLNQDPKELSRCIRTIHETC